MLPAHFNPIGPQLAPTLGAAMCPELAWVAAAALVGMAAVACLVVFEEARSRVRQHPDPMPVELSAGAREAA